jgi:Phosphotransferase enzyme family/Phytanoyl-CoA dioxygenase (PhyH)
MGMRELSKFGSDSKALEWAQQAFAFNHAELISQATWATTYRLDKPSRQGAQDAKQHAFLKLIPRRFGGVAARTSRLASAFALQIPKVIASDDRRGWLLSADHGGTTLDYESPDKDLLAMVKAYARIQVKALHDSDLLAAVPQVDLLSLPQRLLEFVQPGGEFPDANGHVKAAYFLGEEGAGHVRRLLEGVIDLLTDYIRPALALPPTLNHGDLRPPNAAVLADGSALLLDWDDVSVGPAGLSLHGMFSGCTRPIILLSGSPLAQAQAQTAGAKTLRAYVQGLVAGGYASRPALQQALPASMCAGMIKFILSFARFPDENNKHSIQETMQSRITDLLDLCDWLMTRQAGAIKQRTAFYESAGAWRRAQALLQDQVAKNPAELSLYSRLAVASRHEGDDELAEQLIEHITKKAPQDAQAHAQLGELRLARLDLPKARASLNKALALAPRHKAAKVAKAAKSALARVAHIQAMRKYAAVRKNVPILRYEPGDAAAGIARPELAQLGAEMFHEYGFLQIDNAFPVELIQTLQKAFFERYSAYFQTENHPDTLHVGDMRYMLTVNMEKGFDATHLLGSSTVLPIIKRVLGDDCVLGAYTAVISLPGARDQRIHKDHPALFPQTPFHYTVPPFTAQIIIPLVPLNEMTGTTRFYKGSHKVKTTKSEALGHQDPMAGLGSCLLNDYRCAHRGLANRSDLVRPILTMIFNRPWFRDYANYGNQPPLRLPRVSYDAMTEEVQDLVSWWMEEQKVVNMDQQALR